MSDENYISISDLGSFDELYYKLATNPKAFAGKAFFVHKFGFNQDIDATVEDIWSAGGTKAYRASSDTGIVEVVSADATDTAGGTGARAITVEGYDAEGNRVSDWVELNGTTAVALKTPMMDIYRAKITAAGSNDYNAGIITVRHQDGPVTLGNIPAGYNQTQMTHYIVPKGYTGFLVDSVAGIGGIQGAGGSRIGEISVEIREGDNSVWRVKETLAGTSDSGTFGSAFAFPVKLPELARIKFTCNAETSNTQAFAEYDMLFINNQYLG